MLTKLLVPMVIRHRPLPVDVEPKATCERCATRAPTHEVVSSDPLAQWDAGPVVVVGPFHKQVCEPCLTEVRGR
jgi:hypothetical protein